MNKNRLLLAFFVSTVALCVATVSMSVAWYTSSDRARVDTIIMTIDSDRELLISTAADGNYVSKLDNSDLIDADLFAPVTNAYSSRWMSNKSDMPVFYDETILDENADDEVTAKVATSGYFSQKLYILADDDLFVTIDPTDTFIRPMVNANRAYAETIQEHFYPDYSVDQIVERLNKLIHAMRYSILVKDDEDNVYDYVIIDPNKNSDTYYGGVLDNNSDQYYDKFVKDDEVFERVYGEIIGDRNDIYYDEPRSSDSDYKYVDEEPNAFNAKHEKGVRSFNYEKSNIEFKKEEALKVSDFKGKEKPFHFVCKRHEPREIVVSIFIEGWDLDCINHTKGATFESNLSFTVEQEIIL